MADIQSQFRAAMDQDAEGPTDPKPEEADPQGGGDVTCPCCGASAMKIVQAAQQGAGMPTK